MTIDTCNNLDESYVRKSCQANKKFLISYILYNSTYIVFFFFLKKLIYLNWRIITLHYCDGFCITSTWISHGCTCIPPILSHPPTPSLPTLLLLITSPSYLPSQNFHWNGLFNHTREKSLLQGSFMNFHLTSKAFCVLNSHWIHVHTSRLQFSVGKQTPAMNATYRIPSRQWWSHRLVSFPALVDIAAELPDSIFFFFLRICTSPNVTS